LRHNSDLILIGRGILHETMGRLRAHSHAIRESAVSGVERLALQIVLLHFVAERVPADP
jgi:hypothetical protein